MQKLKLRMTEPGDYIELSDWWDWHRWKDSKPSIDLLDNLKFGLMVSCGDENICAGFIYFTNANAFGLLEFVVSTYKVKDKDMRKEAIIFLISSLQEMARRKGVKVLISSLRNQNLIRHYQDCGFVIGSERTTEMVCGL